MSSWVVAATRPRDDTTIDVVPSAGACWHEFVCNVRTKHMQGCGALMWMKWFRLQVSSFLTAAHTACA